MTKATKEVNEELATLIQQLVDNDGHTVIEAEDYTGFCVVYDNKPFIVVILEAKVSEL